MKTVLAFALLILIVNANPFENVEAEKQKKLFESEDCCCEAALYKYSSPGVVPLGSGDVVWTTNYWARQFKVEFDIKVTKELSGTYHNVFHMTIGEDLAHYGDRYPAVWVKKDKKFLIDSGVNGKKNHGKFINYQLNQEYHIEIKQEENSNGEIIYRIVVDGTTVHEVVNTRPQRFEKVILYTSNPWSLSFASFGELKNLNIVNLDKFPA